MTIDYFAYLIVSFLLGMFVVYITAYTKAKGKNKALMEDNICLENDKQKIAVQHRNETEELKKQHSLDIEKRKYQYEEKRHQFSKYFKLLDEFNQRSNETFVEEFIKDQSLITPLVKRSEESGAVAKGYRNDLIAQMKKELDEI